MSLLEKDTFKDITLQLLAFRGEEAFLATHAQVSAFPLLPAGVGGYSEMELSLFMV